MTGETLRRSNWTAHELPVRRSQLESRTASQEDPLAELERIVMRGDPFAERARSTPSNVEPFPGRREPSREEQPAMRREEPRARAPLAEGPEDIFGVDEAAFEAALRGATQPAPAAPAPVEPRFTEIDVARFDEEFASPRERTAPAPREHYAPPAAPQRGSEPLDSEFLRGRDREAFASPPERAEPALFVESAEPAPEEDLPAAEAEREPRRGTGYMTIAAVLGLVALGVGGAVGFTMVTGGARAPVGDPVVVRADDRPNRIVPQQAADDPGKAIQDRLTAQAPPSAERVVPREEEPVQTIAPPTRTDPRTGVPQGAEPRRVTTTTIRVRPDGTMESEPTRPQSQLAAVPQPRPAPAGRQPGQEQAASPAPAAEQPSPAPLAAQAVPVPPSRPERPAQAEPPAAAQPTQLASVAPQANRNLSGPLVQISSQPSEDGARTSLADLQRRFPQLLNGRQTNIRSATAGERTVYRVRVGGFSSQNEAAQFCQRLRSAGGDCFVVPN